MLANAGAASTHAFAGYFKLLASTLVFYQSSGHSYSIDARSLYFRAHQPRNHIQCLRNFLCASANLPPPRLEIQWARENTGHCASLDDMQMDELFNRHPDADADDADPDALVVSEPSPAPHGMEGGGGRGAEQGRE